MSVRPVIPSAVIAKARQKARQDRTDVYVDYFPAEAPPEQFVVRVGDVSEHSVLYVDPTGQISPVT